MDNPITSLDWSLIRAFLSVADTGSLSAAARQLGLSQPTLGRQIRALDQALGSAVFERHPKGLHLTAFGQALRPAARAMAEAAGQIGLIAAGHDSQLAGSVRITASTFVSCFLLPPILADLRQRHPEIDIDLTASDQTENLLFHEADIALRMYRPEQLDMITRHLGDLPLGLYAHRRYFAKRPMPERIEDLFDHDVLGYDRDDRILRGFRDAGLDIDRSFFALRCDDQITNWALLRAGLGIGLGQAAVAATDPDLVQVLPDTPVPTLPVWLTCHESLRHTPRVAAAWDALAHGLARVVS
ncbi:LysR family transcriptional regulator [Rhodophyticola sp. CCM32]|uniref:LysR family transcriptional regulator n=1 Tax=Rhodophyticola sp. CCM32 TaxID=2916397 RepID=UPI00107F9915|nr:LysR family transcriptional regulator [Rhodophyticola sp. CCM32]QBY01685.1 LysR family transcriptional regulator [Rhodophyticola sp. CCM32]